MYFGRVLTAVSKIHEIDLSFASTNHAICNQILTQLVFLIRGMTPHRQRWITVERDVSWYDGSRDTFPVLDNSEEVVSEQFLMNQFDKVIATFLSPEN